MPWRACRLKQQAAAEAAGEAAAEAAAEAADHVGAHYVQSQAVRGCAAGEPADGRQLRRRAWRFKNGWSGR